jgi:hypothetical protein
MTDNGLGLSKTVAFFHPFTDDRGTWIRELGTSCRRNRKESNGHQCDHSTATGERV